MGWDNPPVPWREFERRLSWRISGDDDRLGNEDQPSDEDRLDGSVIPLPVSPSGVPGRSGEPGRRPRLPRGQDPPWAELHCHSSFSFLDGASSPGALVTEAVIRGLSALAITDHDGMYGVPQFAQAAARLHRQQGIRLGTIFGAELGLSELGLSELSPRRLSPPRLSPRTTGSGGPSHVGATPRAGVPDPAARHLLVLARDPEGYARLCRVITDAHLAGGEKGRPVYDEARLAGAHGGHWVVLTGCRKGAVPAALAAGGPAAAERELRTLIEMFGRDHVRVELSGHDQPEDDERNDALVAVAAAAGVEVIATGNVHYAKPSDARLAQALAAVRARSSLDDMDGWLAASGGAYIRSGAEMAARLRRYPGVFERTVELAAACTFDFQVIAPRLPDFPTPRGQSEADWLRELVTEKTAERYGPPGAERVPGAHDQVARELQVIIDLGFPGYFLIVRDIVRFCEESGILCQGRGSAANSAVCYALGITSVDPVQHGLLFERFLSPGRDGPPDIDLDIEHRRREEVIQYVYRTYGRQKAAQVANVISYRPRMALRDAGRALGYAPDQQDTWARQVGPRSYGPGQPIPPGAGVPGPVVALAAQMQKLPRHLGIHSGGMVICDRPVGEVCPVEWARMPGRTVLQWDKDDCAYAGLVKFDLLGLGMLSALRDCFELIASCHGRHWSLHALPQEDPGVYAMLCEADTIGVFQVESRAQMATLPRLRPAKFYDLVVEVALIRPGPIQGGSVHPYMRRKRGDEETVLPHPSMRRALGKTLGVPLFQEQMMQIAVDCAGFTATGADKLRQAMSSKRAPERIEELRSALLEGMAARDIPPDVAEDIYAKILAFSSYGFPESHAISFAYLVYASAWLKCYYPAAFTAALLRCQPMGFYAPASLIGDVRRHGVEVRGVDINASAALATLEARENPGRHERPELPERPASPQHTRPPAGPGGPAGQGPGGSAGDGAVGPVFAAGQDPAGPAAERAADTASAASHPAGGVPVPGQPAIRLGLSEVRNLGSGAAAAIVAGQPYSGLEDFARRTALPAPALETLALAGAFGCFGLSRREALWAAGAAATIRAGQLPGTTLGLAPPPLPVMTAAQETFADLWATGTYGTHPVEHIRDLLTARGVWPAAALRTAAPGAMVAVGGLVTHRQQPGTARGTVFLSLEDESGMANVICPPRVWERYRKIGVDASALVVHGRIERLDGAVSLLATRLQRLRVVAAARSRDFR